MGLEHAQITNLVSNEKIPVLFNPDEYTLENSINYAQSSVPGLSGPILQFVNGNLQTLEMELLVDTYEKHGEGPSSTGAGADVRDLTGKITGLMAIDATTHAPPVLLFSWGSLYFKCVLARVSQRFIMFRPDGIPVRARLNVTFNEYLEPAREAKEVSRLTADYTKEHIVLDGETLSAVAARLYDDPLLWRPIALRNRIADPRGIVPGQRLLVPSLPYADPSTGEVIG